MAQFKTQVTEKMWRRKSDGTRDWFVIDLNVYLTVDEWAIMKRLALRAYQNKNRRAKFMHGAIVVEAIKSPAKE